MTNIETICTNYLDASVIVKLVLKEDGHLQVRSYFDKESVFLTTSLCFGEALGVLSTKYKRGDLSQENYLAACDELIALLRNNSFEIYDCDIKKFNVYNAVENMIRLYNHNKSFDLSDAFQIISLKTILPGLDRSSLLLVTADKFLAKAARKEGLRAWYVMTEPAPV